MNRKTNKQRASSARRSGRLPAIVALAAFFVLLCAYGAAARVGADNPAATFAVTAAFAVAAVIVEVLLARAGFVSVPRLGEGWRRPPRAAAVICLCCAAAGAVVGCLLTGMPASAAAEGAVPVVPTEWLSGTLPCRLLYVVASALVTAVFEEVQFRGLLFPALVSGVGGPGGAASGAGGDRASSSVRSAVEQASLSAPETPRASGEEPTPAIRAPRPLPHAVAVAAWASGAVFGLAHVSLAGAGGDAVSASILVGALLKFASATLFGYAMAVIAARAGTLRPAISVHAVYDMALAAPLAVTGCTVASWTPIGPLALAAFAIELAFCAALAFAVSRTVRVPRF
jgi:hypothetical protein